MAELNKFVLPVKNESTGVITNQEFDLPSGGGGSSSFEALTDVDIDDQTLANGDVPVYNSTTQKWENGQVDVSNKMNIDGSNSSQTVTLSNKLIVGKNMGGVTMPITSISKPAGNNQLVTFSLTSGRAFSNMQKATLKALSDKTDVVYTKKIDGTIRYLKIVTSGITDSAFTAYLVDDISAAINIETTSVEFVYRASIYGNYASSIGDRTLVSGNYAHAEGSTTVAGGNYSHAEGMNTYSGGTSSHSEGGGTTASGNYSHAEGYYTNATGNYGAHAEGYYTTAGYSGQTVVGKYNSNKSTTLFEVGNGTSSSYKSNAFEVYSDGSLSTNNGTTKTKLPVVKTNTITNGSVTFTDLPSSGNNMIDFYTSVPGANYTAISTSGTSVTLTYGSEYDGATAYCSITEVV